MHEPFFIIGTERSGSNLLRAILNSHSDISIPHPPHIMKELGPYENNYGDLNKDSNFLNLIDDVIKVVSLHFVKWPLALNRQDIYTKAKAKTLYAVNAVIYDDYAISQNKKRWGCKSTFMINYIDEIIKVDPGAQFIHLIRDGRDVAASARKSVFNHFHPYYVAKLWSKEQAIALNWKKKLPAEQFKTIHYEELISMPEAVIKELCHFLKIDYQDNMLSYFEKDEVRDLSKLSEAWKNVSKTILSDNSKKYKKDLSPDEIALFEAHSAREMIALGYELENDINQLQEMLKRLTTTAKIRYYLLENYYKFKVEFEAMQKDKNFIPRWKKKFYLWRIHGRSSTN